MFNFFPRWYDFELWFNISTYIWGDENLSFYFEVQNIEDGQQLEVDGDLFNNGFDLTFYFIKAPSLKISVNISTVLLLLKNSNHSRLVICGLGYNDITCKVY